MGGFGFPSALSTTGLAGDPIFFEGSTDSVPGSPKTIFTVVVGAGVSINLVQLLATAQFSGVFRVFNNLDLIASARTRPGNPNIFFSWFPSRTIIEADVLKVEFEQRANSPIVSVDAFLMAAEES
jgi:hypothetical protein